MSDHCAWESLCATCRTLHQVTGYVEKVDIGTVAEIVAKSSCCICRLILSLLLPRPVLNEDAESQASPSSRRIVLRKMGRNGFIIWYRGTIRGELNYIFPDENLDPKSLWWFPFKRFPHAIPDELDHEKVKRWITKCDQDHVDCNRNQSGRSRRIPTPTWFIDTFQNCLVYKDTSERFLALSYVWGNAVMFKTSSANRRFLQRPGAFLSLDYPLNPVVQDAIKVSRCLRERYLWIDALCIVQDEEVSKANLITQMDSIYAQAFLTIVAASGDSADTHLPGVWPNTRLANTASVQITAPTSKEKVPNQFVAVRPSFDSALDQSVYYSRGWTFQEIHLSRRSLIFTDHETFFCCDTRLETDAGPCGDSEMWLQKNMLTPLFNAQEHQVTESDQFNLYTQLIYDFSKRNLTYPGDALRAISGIFSMLSNQFKWGFIAGMPSHLIYQALLWRPMSPNPSRNSNFPSWSWAGWSSQLHWHFYSFWDPYWMESDIRETTLVPVKPEMEILEAYDVAKLDNRDAGRSIQISVLKVRVDLVSRDTFQIKPSETSDCSPESMPIAPSRELWTLAGLKCGILFDWKDEEIGVCSMIALSKSRWEQDGVLAGARLEGERIVSWFEHVCDQERLTRSEYCFVNVMMVVTRDGITERIGIGLIHSDVWSEVAKERVVIDLR